ncbi:MAG: HEAT repeat domain-containing protein [Promethearchaeota archaeon]
MYRIPIHPAIKYSRHMLCVGLLITFIGLYSYVFVAVLGTIIFIIGFVMQIYLNRKISKYRVKTSLSIDFLFPEIDNWVLAPKFVDMPEEDIPTEMKLDPNTKAELLYVIQNRGRKRRDAASQLAMAGPSVIPDVVPLLDYDHPDVRSLAVSILRYLGNRSVDAVTNLIDVLKDADVEFRNQAICTLALIGPPAKAAIPQLVKLLGTEDEDTSICAAIAIGRINTSKDVKDKTLKALQNLRDNPNSTIQLASSLALHSLGQTDDQTVQILIQGLRNRNAIIALLSTETLGFIGEPAKEAIPDLVEALGGQHPIIFIKVAHALYRMGYDPLVLLRPILQSGRSGEIYVRMEVLEILEDMGSTAEAAIPAYVRMLTDRNTLTRVVAVRAISFLGEGARSLVPQIRQAISDPARAVSYHAKRILETLGEPLEESVEVAPEEPE